MKKFFGTSSKSKSKSANPNQNYTDETTPPATPGLQTTPIHSAHAVYLPQQAQAGNLRALNSGLQPLRPNSALDPDQSAEELPFDPPPSIPVSRNSSFGSLQAPNLPLGTPNNPVSPAPNTQQTLRKKQPQRDNTGGSVSNSAQAPGVSGILRALDPPPPNHVPHHSHNPSSSDLPVSGRETPISYMQAQSDDAPHKDKLSKWNLFSRINDDTNKDRRKEEKVPLSAKDLEARKVEKERREERERHWQFVDREEKKEPQPFRREDKAVDREREAAELTRMIGYLTATASEDWALVLEVCERASSNEANAKEAVRALRREFKYGPPQAQLSAARLWAIMLRNSSEIFITQCTSRKFLDTLEDLLTNTGGGPFGSGKGTSPVVRERVMDVLAAAAYASGTRKDTGFRGLWKKVKPIDKPDEGVPFDTDDAMFNPPLGGRASYSEVTPPAAADSKGIAHYDPTNPNAGHTERPEREHKKDRSERDREGRHKDREHRSKDRDREHREHRPRDREHKEHKEHKEHREHKEHKDKKPRNRIIPLEEDIRRLFQECKIGVGNANLLSQALVHARLEELKRGDRGEVIREFRLKCISSQELIAAQIPWATAGAERSRKEKEREVALLYGETDDPAPGIKDRDRTVSNHSALADAAGIPGRESPIDEQTTEEKLLAALLEANEELLAALGQYDDLERVAIERRAEEKSRKEIRMDRRTIATLEQQSLEDPSLSSGGSSANLILPSSRSPSPSNHGSRPPSVVMQHPLPQHPHSLLPHPQQQLVAQSQAPSSTHSPEIPSTTLAPPRAPPHGPRSPALHTTHSGHPHGHSRTGSSGYPSSRTPSPNTPSMESSHWTGENVGGSGAMGAASSMGSSTRDKDLLNGLNSSDTDKGKAVWTAVSVNDSDDEILTPIKPSAKALGKRRIEASDEPEQAPFNPDDLYYDQNKDAGSTDQFNPYAEGDFNTPLGEAGYNSDSDDSESAYYPDGRPRSRNEILHHLHHPPVHFVYDAAAERTQQRIREMEMERTLEVSNVH